MRVRESALKTTCIRRAVQEMGKDQLMIEFYRVRYASPDLTDDSGALVQFSCEGCVPLGELLGLRTGFERSLASLTHRIICDMLAGLRMPNDGAVVLPPHIRVGTVPSEPVFIGTLTLLENLRYVTGNTRVPEKTVWTLCKHVGLPSHLCSSAKGQQVMARLSFSLSSAELSLFSLVRTLLSMPDLLLINKLPIADEASCAKIGVVLQDFVAVSDYMHMLACLSACVNVACRTVWPTSAHLSLRMGMS